MRTGKLITLITYKDTIHTMFTNNETTTNPSVTEELPASLRPGGLIERGFDHALKTDTRGLDGGKLREQVLADLKNIRDAYAQVMSGRQSGVPAHPDQALCVALTNQFYQRDPVLRYSVAFAENQKELARRLYHDARTAYLARPDVYDAVLADAIPEDFWNACRAHLAEQAYLTGTNPTAVSDWGTYLTLENNRPTGRVGLPTGLESLDRVTGGTQGLVFVAGESGVGKSTLAMTMALAAQEAQPDLGVVYFSFDMLKGRIYQRIRCREASLDDVVVEAREYSKDQQEALVAADEKIGRTVMPRLRVVEWGDAQRFLQDGPKLKRRRLNFAFLTDSIAQFTRAAKVRKVLVVVDSFGRMEVAKPGTAELAVDQQRLALLVQLRDWSRSAQNPDGCPVVVVAEVRKDGGRHDELELRDLLGSAKLGYAADTVIGVQRDTERKSAKGVAPLILRTMKSRAGVVGESVPVTFNFRQYRITEAISTPPKGDAPAKRRYAGTN